MRRSVASRNKLRGLNQEKLSAQSTIKILEVPDFSLEKKILEGPSRGRIVQGRRHGFLSGDESSASTSKLP